MRRSVAIRLMSRDENLKFFNLISSFGGEGGIRDPDRLTPMPHFQCGAFSSLSHLSDGRSGRAPTVGARYVAKRRGGDKVAVRKHPSDRSHPATTPVRRDQLRLAALLLALDPGRGEFVRLALEDAGAEMLIDVARGPRPGRPGCRRRDGADEWGRHAAPTVRPALPQGWRLWSCGQTRCLPADLSPGRHRPCAGGRGRSAVGAPSCSSPSRTWSRRCGHTTAIASGLYWPRISRRRRSATRRNF